jgi:FERM/RhoGEF/pleckstrin domain-containing protein 1
VTIYFLPKHLAAHLWKHSEALEALETSIKGSRRLEHFCRDFELQKVCYLPLNTFLLRPLHRLMHYKHVLERLCKHHPPNHADFRDCRGRDAGARSHSRMLGPLGASGDHLM